MALAECLPPIEAFASALAFSQSAGLVFTATLDMGNQVSHVAKVSAHQHIRKPLTNPLASLLLPPLPLASHRPHLSPNPPVLQYCCRLHISCILKKIPCNPSNPYYYYYNYYSCIL